VSEATAGFFARLKQRKLVQWALAYAAFAFALLQGVDVVAHQFGWPDGLQRGITLVLIIGFVVALVLAWYHGERGAQKVSGTEIVILALLLAIGGGLLWRYERIVPTASSPDATVGPTSSGRRGATPVLATRGSPQIIPIPAKSVAVLPFENLSGDTNEKYFSNGITEEILNALAQIPDLKVAGRTSAFQFNSRDGNLRHIGEILGVADVLVGSVQKAGDEVRINVQLVDTSTGYQRWSEKYDRKLTNIFAVEDDISSAIAGKLRVQLTGGGGQPLVAQETIDPRAHDSYLRGLALLAARGPGLRDAAAAFQSAIRIAPNYAEAWGALAEAQALYPDYGLGTMRSADPLALANARHALSLNADLASAYVAQGMVYKDQWRWPQADQAFRRAVSLAPGDAEAVNQQAQFLLAIGQFNSALAEIEHAQRLDPLSPSIGDTREYLLMILGQYEAASEQLQRTLATHPDFVDAWIDEIDLAVIHHNYAEAERQARLLAPLVGIDPDLMASWVHGIADPALRADAVRSLETAPGAAHLRRDPLAYAQWLALLGARDRALAVLERLPIQRNSPEPDWMWDISFDPIRHDPRFKAVLKKMGLPYTPDGAANHE
jgi:TolB-like protein/Tfp pilus assembly protein PilF